MAKELHKMNPNLYKDDNHKPEMALELKQVLEDVPEIVEAVGIASAKQVMDIHDQGGAANEIKSALRSSRTLFEESEGEEELVLELEKQYPGDIGVLSAFLLNYVKLKGGNFVCAANEPHAYLSGDCIQAWQPRTMSSELVSLPSIVMSNPLFHPHYNQVHFPSNQDPISIKGYPEILLGLPLSPYITRYLSTPFFRPSEERPISTRGFSL
ncbi:mannose-6-phosphate isomerase 2-like [Hibiscus syriacus]|uniref:mannose-6-phosphate isomerase 2-like n=1 Tax=Hibiscus syriacus TaxID=106335 RepID=UPI001923D7AE|nr:mannose-6-phosphate isomerase 2-like [Hibiscus syriacus]